MKLNAKNERKLVTEILMKLGTQENQADIVAQATVDADLKGFTSHGIGRFSQYIKGLENGNINLEGDIDIEKETEAMALINGNSLFGQYVARKAMDLAIEKAKKVGIGAVGTHNGNHFGVTGYYSDLASREGCVGIVIANTEPAIAPFGGKKPMIGTNPIAIGVPNDDTYIALDMATSVAARGKLLEAKRKFAEGNDDPKDGGLALFRAHRGLPKNTALIKFLSEPGIRVKLQKAENYYLADQQKEMPKADAELFFYID